MFTGAKAAERCSWLEPFWLNVCCDEVFCCLSLVCLTFLTVFSTDTLHAQCVLKQSCPGPRAGALAFAVTFAVIGFVTFSVGGAAAAAAPSPAPSAAGNAAGRQVSGTRQRDEDAGWKRVQHPKKTKEEATQSSPHDKLLQDGWSVKVENSLVAVQRTWKGVFLARVKAAQG